jgi:hypothetical protein
MSNVFVWPLLLSRDRGLATLALQGHINSTFCGSPPHIIEQVLQLIQSLSLAAAIAELAKDTASAFEIFEMQEPILRVIAGMLQFLSAKKAASAQKLSSTATQQLLACVVLSIVNRSCVTIS